LAGGWLASRWRTRAEVRRLRSWARIGTRQLTRSVGSTMEIEGVAAARRRGGSGSAQEVIDGVFDVRERNPSRRKRLREGKRKREKERLRL